MGRPIVVQRLKHLGDDFACNIDYAGPMPRTISPIHPSADFLTGLLGADAARGWLDAASGVGGIKPGEVNSGGVNSGGVKAMLISLPRLQTVNLAYGQAAGDQMLVDVAHRIDDFAQSDIGADPLIARLAGGQFLVASRAAPGRDRWQYLAEALGRVIGRALTVEGDAVPGGSIALLEADLLGAMHRDEITVLFQPQFDCRTGALAGAEALARWEHPRFGRIAAETLFAVADRGDHVAQLSHHIARRALSLAAAWPRALRMSLNITAEDFALGDVAGSVRRLLAQTGFAADRLTLEITEQSLIGDFEACALALQTLATDGVQVALDDFGTGYSNFRTMKALPLDTLKLDRSLVRDIAQDPRDRAIVAAMIAMARALDLKVIAEGIESEAQLQVLAEEGCDLFQGFLRAGPVSADDFARLAAA